MIESDPQQSQAVEATAGNKSRGARSRRLSSHVAALVRWLHIYLSMFAFAALLFFSVTGITLNHPEWFPSENAAVDVKGVLPQSWLQSTGGDHSGVRRLEIVERLRAEHSVRGALAEFRVDDSECMLSFKGPGYAADAFIERETGEYNLTVVQHGLTAVINDLHKGRDSGRAWAWAIDVSALLLILAGVTGLVLLFYIKRRRVAGMAMAIVGAAALAAAAYWLTP